MEPGPLHPGVGALELDPQGRPFQVWVLAVPSAISLPAQAFPSPSSAKRHPRLPVSCPNLRARLQTSTRLFPHPGRQWREAESPPHAESSCGASSRSGSSPARPLIQLAEAARAAGRPRSQAAPRPRGPRAPRARTVWRPLPRGRPLPPPRAPRACSDGASGPSAPGAASVSLSRARPAAPAAPGPSARGPARLTHTPRRETRRRGSRLPGPSSGRAAGSGLGAALALDSGFSRRQPCDPSGVSGRPVLLFPG